MNDTCVIVINIRVLWCRVDVITLITFKIGEEKNFNSVFYMIL